MRWPGLVFLLLLCACGDIKSVTAGGDAGGGDGGAPDARAVGTVTVTVGKVFGTTQPLAGNQVVLVDTAGQITADVETDSDGVASADDIEAGSTMIILIATPPTGAPTGNQALVIVGVEPGDDIHIDPEGHSGAGAGPMTVSWPSHGVNNYQLSTGCRDGSSGGTTTDMTFDDDCLVDGDAQIMIRAVDDGGNTVGWVGGTVPFSTPGAFDVAGPWADPRMLDVTLTDIPSEALRVRPGVLPVRGGLPFVDASEPSVDLTDNTMVVHAAMPTVFADSALVTLAFEPNQPTLGGTSLARGVERDADSLDIALADELLPWYGTPLLDVPTRTFSWTRTSGHQADAQYLLMFWTDKGVPDERLTLVMVPPELTEVTLPELPAEYETFLPVNAEQVGIQIQAAESSELDGYRGARQTGFSLIYNQPTIGLDSTSTLRRSFGGEDF